VASPLTDTVAALGDRIGQLEARVAELVLELRAKAAPPTQANTDLAPASALEPHQVDTRRPPVGCRVAVKLDVGGLWCGVVLGYDEVTNAIRVDVEKLGPGDFHPRKVVRLPDGWGA
jgi:hypothetical protein